MIIDQANENIITEALQDYRRWFDEDEPEKLKEIDTALTSFNDQEFFPITSVCKDDIIHAFNNDADIKKIVEKLDDSDMETLASKLGSDYCEQLYWDSLKIIFELTFT